MLIDHDRIMRWLRETEGRLTRPAELFLVGECCLVAAGLRQWTDMVVYCPGQSNPDALAAAANRAANELGLPALKESPAEVVPLPDGHHERAIPLREGKLSVLHFDPYSTAVRLLARGDEPDYHTVLGYLEHGWLDLAKLEDQLAALLPSFTAGRIQQDPAEFRRKFKGMRQMWMAYSPHASEERPRRTRE